MLYADDGSIRITVVSGLLPVGAYAPDGSMNVIEGVIGTKGLYHPCGAMNVCLNVDSSTVAIPAYSPSGFRNIVLPPFTTNILTGALRCTIVSGSFAPLPPSLITAGMNIDFARQSYLEDGAGYKNISSGFSLTRASTGTYINSNGLISTAANDIPRYNCELNTGVPRGLLVEAASTNLLLRSQVEATAPWIITNSTISNNAGVAPDGTLTASRYTHVSAGFHYQAVTVLPNTTYTYSFYVKTEDFDPAGFATAFYDQTNLAFISTGLTFSGINSTTWTRVVQQVTTPATCVTMRCYPCRPTTATDGTSVLMWGHQLEQSNHATSYIPTTTVQVTRAADINVKLSTAAVNAGLQKATTNLLIRSSEIGTGGVWINSITVTSNTTVSPDTTTNAETLTSTGAGNQALYQVATVTPNTTYTFSYYVQLGTMTAADYKFAIYDQTNAVFLFVDIVPNVTPVVGSWNRVWFTFTTPATCTLARCYVFRNSAVVAAGLTAFVWGAQLEVGDYPSNYVPTTAAQATATAVTGNGTILIKYYRPGAASGVLGGYANSASPANENMYLSVGTVDQTAPSVTAGGVVQTSYSSVTNSATLLNKACLTFGPNDSSFSANGSAIQTDNTFLPPSGLDQFGIGLFPVNLSSNQIDLCINSITLWPNKRSNADVVALTTL